MIANLIFGLPGQQPGGLMLTLITAAGSAACALVLGAVYATICVEAPRASLGLQAALALLRGVPLLLLVFVLATATPLPLPMAGFLALVIYSLCHVGESLRSFLASYPAIRRDQARLMGLGFLEELYALRLPWTARSSINAVGTHWISLLKDTGALTVLGISELTTVARVLSERASLSDWGLTLATAAGLYLGATVVLIRVLEVARQRWWSGGLVGA